MRKAAALLLLLAAMQLASAQHIPVPPGYTVLDTVSGDLDKDLVPELVVAYNTQSEEDNEGVPRDLVIYKRSGKAWKEWKRSAQALYGSQDGGMMGDPYGGMEIKNGVLHISHNGGSSWKWAITDKYRYQDSEFYLIGYTSIAGKPCENWLNVDFNISTGKMVVTKEYETCDEIDEGGEVTTETETLSHKGLKVTLQSRQAREIKITTPQYKREIYIASGQE